MPSTISIPEVRKQQIELSNSGRLRPVHWLIVTSSIVFTLSAWHVSTNIVEERERLRFEFEAHEVVDQVEVRLAHYEDALLGGVAALLSHSQGLTRTEWQRYAEKVDIINRYPGINGIGVIRQVDKDDMFDFESAESLQFPGFKIFPEHAFPIKLPIVFIEPEEANRPAIGLDVAFETNRRQAALLARDLGTPQISGPIELVQADKKTPGFLFYAPFYADKKHFGGLVYAPLVVSKFINGLFGTYNRQIFFSIHDGDDLLYNDLFENLENVGMLETLRVTKRLYGREWHFTLARAPSVESLSQPTVVLGTGIFINLLLLFLFLHLTRTNRRVLDLAQDMTNELVLKAEELDTTNQSLERFAYVVSHDLKAPIRGISQLTDFIEEDLETYLADDGFPQAISKNIKRLRRQTNKSRELIDGILAYSIVGVTDEPQVMVDVVKIISDVRQTLGVREDQIRLVGEFPIFETYAIRLEQILQNLIGNAFMYHPFPDDAVVAVTCERKRLRYYTFSVIDDGYGIDEKYHASIFDPFTSLQSNASTSSSGIGLSIVKKAVESLGGEVRLESKPGEGSTFTFEWPCYEEPVRTTL